MIITKMTASFGRLEQQTLCLEPGLNVLTRPNEGGKSTWAAFLLAMFYGVDTAQRARQGLLPDKTKYKPWSGKPMQGQMELITDAGRRIRLERSSRGRTPMGEFAAFDMDTGLPIDGLTAENCGLTLLGVERSVFARSAFIQGTTLALTADEDLERRLTALVTTGDEQASASGALRLLREQKNQILHNKTGLLPQAQREKEQLAAQAAQLHDANRLDLELHGQEQALSQQKAALDRQAALLRAQELSEKRAALQAAKADTAQAQAALDKARERVRKYPPEAQLGALQRELSARKEQADAPLPEEPAPPVCPPVFESVPPERVMEKAQQDAREFDRLTAGKRPVLWPLAVQFPCALILTAICAAAGKFVFCAFWGALALAAVVLFGFGRKRRAAYEQNMDKAQALLAAYENRPRDEFAVYAAQYREQLLVYRQRKAAFDAALSQRQAARQQRAEQQAKILGAASVFAPGVQTAADALRAIGAAQADYADLRACENALARAESREQALENAYGELPDTAAPADAPRIDAVQLARQRAQNEQALAQIRSQRDRNRGRAAALSDPALEENTEALDARIEALHRRYQAIELAEQTLCAADAALQTRFAPQIAARAGSYFSRLTADRYDRVLFDKAMNLSAGERDQAGVRQLLQLSTGTADQLYLAARLAISELLLPEKVPFVLDDALLTFDDARAAAALALLAELGKSRQILLFSCQGREASLLAAQPVDKITLPVV